MELGITPIITSGMVFQLLAGTHLIDVNLDMKADRELYQTAQKRKEICKMYEVGHRLIWNQYWLLSLLSVKVASTLPVACTVAQVTSVLVSVFSWLFSLLLLVSVCSGVSFKSRTALIMFSRHSPRRTPPEGLWSWFWYLPFHCDKHLRVHHVEGLLSHHN